MLLLIVNLGNFIILDFDWQFSHLPLFSKLTEIFMNRLEELYA